MFLIPQSVQYNDPSTTFITYKTASRLKIKDQCSHKEKVHWDAVFVLVCDCTDLGKSLESPAHCCVSNISTNKNNSGLLDWCLPIHAGCILTVTWVPPYHNKKSMLTHNVDTVWSKLGVGLQCRDLLLYLLCCSPAFTQIVPQVMFSHCVWAKEVRICASICCFGHWHSWKTHAHTHTPQRLLVVWTLKKPLWFCNEGWLTLQRDIHPLF